MPTLHHWDLFSPGSESCLDQPTCSVVAIAERRPPYTLARLWWGPVCTVVWEGRSVMGVHIPVAVPVSSIESKANCPPDISHLCRGQGCDQGTDSSLRYSLQVVTVDSAFQRHAVGFREKDLRWYVANRTCNGGDSNFTKILQH